MARQRVVAIDPGETTGVMVGLFTQLGNQAELEICEAFETHQFEGLEDQIDDSVQLVLCERLTNRHPSFNPIGFEVVGVVRFLAAQANASLVLQAPSILSAPRKLFALPFSSQHICDAAHHAIAFMTVWAKARKLAPLPIVRYQGQIIKVAP